MDIKIQKEGNKYTLEYSQMINESALSWIKDKALFLKKVANREAKETILAARILLNILYKKEVTDDQVRFLKSQSVDLAKVIALLGLQALPFNNAMVLFFDKLFKKLNIPFTFYPSSHSDEKNVEVLKKAYPELELDESKKKYNKKYLTKDKSAMKKEIDKHSKKDDDDKSAYGKWPADYKNRNTKSGERHKTKKSDATKAYEKMFGKKNESAINENYKKALQNKSDDSGINYSTLKKVYDKGLAAWKTGHRPGTSQHQWAMGRVNSFITGSGGARNADQELWKKAKAEKKKNKEKKNESYGPKFNLNEGHRGVISEGLRYHIKNDQPIIESVYRYGSKEYCELFHEVKKLYKEGVLNLCDSDKDYVDVINYEKVRLKEVGEVVLDLIYEAEYQGKKVELNKPKRGGSKKYYVYVRDPKTKKIKKVSFGAKSGGGKLAVKLKDPKARKAFADRHNCSEKKDKTKAGYWSCRLPRYAKQLGLSGGGSYYW